MVSRSRNHLSCRAGGVDELAADGVVVGVDSTAEVDAHGATGTDRDVGVGEAADAEVDSG